DLLTGSADKAVDKYVFGMPPDSGLTAATRDTIEGFEDGFDLIDIAALGASNFKGLNTTFSGKGDVRVVMKGTGWIITGETPGAGKAEFSIAVIDATHAIGWSAADFMLMS